MYIRRLWAVPSSYAKGTGAGPKVRKQLVNKCLLSMQELTRSGPNTVNFPPPEGKKPDAVYTLQTTKESAHLYR